MKGKVEKMNILDSTTNVVSEKEKNLSIKIDAMVEVDKFVNMSEEERNDFIVNLSSSDLKDLEHIFFAPGSNYIKEYYKQRYIMALNMLFYLLSVINK